MKPFNLVIISFCLVSCTLAATGNPSCMPSQIHLSLGDAYYPTHDPENFDPAIKNNQNQAYLVWHSKEVCQFLVSVTNLHQTDTLSAKPVDFYQSFEYNFTTTEEEKDNVTYKTVVYTAFIDSLDYGVWYNYVIQDVIGDYSIKPTKFRLVSPEMSNTTYTSADYYGSLINKTITNKIVIMGNIDTYDQGLSTIQSVSYDVRKDGETFAGVIQIGGIAYNLESNNGVDGDDYFAEIEELASITPLVITSGEIGSFADYSFFDLRIRNPLFNQTNNRYFSYNLQGIHFVAIDFDYYEKSTPEGQSRIFSWIENDLKLANDSNTRRTSPFVVVISSQSIYCIDSPFEADEGVGCGDYYYKRQKWDSLFFNYNVDLMLSASETSYQRMWPMYKNVPRGYYTVEDSSDENLILNPPATVYINEGIAGYGEEAVPDYEVSDYAEAISTEPGFGHLYIINSTIDVRLAYDHYSSTTGELIDTVTLVRTYNSDGTLAQPQTNNSSHLSTILKIAIPVGVLLIGCIVACIICKRRKDNLKTALMDDDHASFQRW